MTLLSCYVFSRGGWDNVLQRAPSLDASTPRSQNGFLLLDIQRPRQWEDQYGRTFSGFQYKGVDYLGSSWSEKTDREDAFGIWVKPPSLPDSFDNNDIDSQQSTFGKAFSVTARLSTGDVLPLDWHLRTQKDIRLPTNDPAMRLLFISLPTGYSSECRSVDIAVADQGGHTAHWLFSHLPRMRHVVPAPSHPVSTITKDGISLSVKAWHPQAGQPNGLISYILHPVLPPDSHQWDIVTTEQSREWEPFDFDSHKTIYASSGTPILDRNGVFSPPQSWYGGGILSYDSIDYYPQMTRFLRISTELRQFETDDEPVTFHNVAVGYGLKEYRVEGSKYYCLELPHALSVTTPSGITVTLPVQGSSLRPMLEQDALSFLVSITPLITEYPTAYSLPASPLARKFGKPITLSLTFPPPYEVSGWSNESNGTPANYAMRLPMNPDRHPTPKGVSVLPLHENLPAVLKTLTLIIRQRVDLQTIPMTFTVPIDAHAPSYFPGGHKSQ
ncbi:MAG: hypothetical protein ACRYFS_15630 [Janthinobacterium lividum]